MRTLLTSLTERKVFGIQLIYFVLLAFCLFLALITPYVGIYHWVAVLGIVVVTAVLIATFSDLHVGFYLFFIYSFFMFYLGRLLWPIEIPVGVFFDFFIVLLLIAIGIKRYKNELKPQAIFKDLVGKAILVYCAYDLFCLFNPFAISFTTSLPGIRNAFYFLTCFYLFYVLLRTEKQIKDYTNVWIFLSLLAALYGLYQEYVGLMDWELKWIQRDERAFELVYQWGKIRKWSFLSDVSSMGILMSYGAIFCIVLALGPFKANYRIYLIISALLMMLAMIHTGTRTATAMIPLGFAFYFILTINHLKTVIVAGIVGLAFLAILYGPFYDPTSMRIKSAFNSKDESFEFRNFKRKLIQKWVWSHPLGTGFNTANQISEQVSITPAPDNGYLRTAIDKGVPGILIQLILFFTFFYRGIINYFQCRHKVFKHYYAAYLSAFFPVTIANFVQDAVEQKPMILIFISSFVLIEIMIKFKNQEAEKLQEETVS